MSNNLFSEFDQVSTKAWKQKIQYDLKGADYNKTLVWNTNDDIHVKPFYNLDDLKEFPTPNFIRETAWKICEPIFVANTAKSNERAIDAIKRGAESIKFIIPDKSIFINELIKDIDLNRIWLYFELDFIDLSFIKQISQIPTKAGLYVSNDIIGNLARTGNWYTNVKEDHRHFETIISTISSISVDVRLYQNAGANMVQQLAYALSHANEYLNHLDQKISKNIKQSFQTTFNVAIGTNYFFEIAKLRALRLLYSTLANEYGFNTNCHLIATPTKRDKTLYDYNTNMFRTTTEYMSAILGQADTICVQPYDAIFHKENDFSQRIGRNQLLILKHESYFNKVNNPADGAYYIESLTQQLAEKALKLFKDIEAHGGFLHQLKKGIIQRKIKENSNKEQEQFNNGQEILLGTNKFQNPKDKMKQELELYPFVKNKNRKTLIEPIIEKRLAENIEQQRLKTE